MEIIQLNRKSKRDFGPLLRIASLLRERRIDVVQPFLSPATFFGLLPSAASSRTIRIVTERCGVRRSRGFGNKTYRFVEDLLSRGADAVIPNSAAGRDDVLRRGIHADCVQVIYNGINLERLTVDQGQVSQIRARLGVPAHGHVVGVLASLTPPKGHDMLLRAFRALCERRTGVRLAVVGDGPLRASLEGLAVQLGVADAVEFFGYQRNVADFLTSFDVLVSPSRDNEGTSNSIIEAMSLGVPIVATDVGGNREVVANGVTGLLTPVDDPVRLAGALETMLCDASGTRAMADAACEIARSRFGLRRMVNEYEELYVRLLQRRTQGVAAASGAAGSPWLVRETHG